MWLTALTTVPSDSHLNGNYCYSLRPDQLHCCFIELNLHVIVAIFYHGKCPKYYQSVSEHIHNLVVFLLVHLFSKLYITHQTLYSRENVYCKKMQLMHKYNAVQFDRALLYSNLSF